MNRIQVVQTINYYVKLTRKIIFIKSLLKTINTKTRGRPPLSKPEKLRRAVESKARKETLRDVNRTIDNTGIILF
jgi:hypothetical protein